MMQRIEDFENLKNVTGQPSVIDHEFLEIAEDLEDGSVRRIVPHCWCARRQQMIADGVPASELTPCGYCALVVRAHQEGYQPFDIDPQRDRAIGASAWVVATFRKA